MLAMGTSRTAQLFISETETSQSLNSLLMTLSICTPPCWSQVAPVKQECLKTSHSATVPTVIPILDFIQTVQFSMSYYSTTLDQDTLWHMSTKRGKMMDSVTTLTPLLAAQWAVVAGQSIPPNLLPFRWIPAWRWPSWCQMTAQGTTSMDLGGRPQKLLQWGLWLHLHQLCLSKVKYYSFMGIPGHSPNACLESLLRFQW